MNVSDVEATIEYSNDINGVDYYIVYAVSLSDESTKIGETRFEVSEENQVT